MVKPGKPLVILVVPVDHKVGTVEHHFSDTRPRLPGLVHEDPVEHTGLVEQHFEMLSRDIVLQQQTDHVAAAVVHQRAEMSHPGIGIHLGVYAWM